jgi:phosphoribosylanthranilate isomerase
MKPHQLKICGMRDAQNILAIADLRPNWMGFIFYPDSPRYVGVDFKMPEVRPEINRVGVFVNAPVEDILGKAALYGLNTIQLHGQESPEDCLKIKLSGLQVIKVFHMDGNFEFSTTDVYSGFADYFLFDTRGKNPGGNAIKFDWSLLEQYQGKTPFFLSGGITLNDFSAISQISNQLLTGIDVNSGAELSPAYKSPEMVSKFINLLKNI